MSDAVDGFWFQDIGQGSDAQCPCGLYSVSTIHKHEVTIYFFNRDRVGDIVIVVLDTLNDLISLVGVDRPAVGRYYNGADDNGRSFGVEFHL